MLECLNVTKKYAHLTAVDNLSLNMMPGSIYALLGSNGSGKTTLMKMIAGLVKPTSGTITFNGSPIGIESKKYIAYMPTESYFYTYMTAKDVGNYYRDFFEDFSIERYNIFLRDMELPTNLKVNKMSSGMMAKLKLAVTLSRNSFVYMLDEPLNGIDIIARERIINTIIANMAPERIIIMSSHLVDELEPLMNYAIFMKNGILVNFGKADDLRKQTGKSIVELYKEIYSY